MAAQRIPLFDEQSFNLLSDVQKPVFLLEWLRQLELALENAARADVKSSQKQLVEQLMQIIMNGPGPPGRKLVARCMATLFVVGDTIHLFDTVNKCNDLLKSKDDSPSSLQIKLAATSVLGEMYEKLGRMMGRSYEETVHILSKSFKNMESQSRIETMLTFEKISAGMDVAASTCHKEIYRIARVCLTDRVMPVRAAAAKCIEEMMKSSTFLYTSELESVTSMCLRALDGADYDARIAVANLLGTVIAYTQRPPAARTKTNIPQNPNVKSAKQMTLEESLNILLTGFLRGATSFLKGEIIKGGSGVNREVRVGVTHAYVAFVESMGSVWLEKNIDQFTTHVLELVANPKAATSHVDAVYSRKCINFILRRSYGRLLGEKAQVTALKVLNATVLKQMSSVDYNPENTKECNQDVIANQHLLVCVLQEMAVLFLTLGTSIQHLVQDGSLGMIDGLFSVLIHPCQSTRLSAAWAIRCLCVALPAEAHKCIERCLQAFDNLKSSPEAVSGYSSALAAILGGVRFMPLGIPYATGKIVFNTAEDLLRSASQNSRLSMQKSSAGWILIGAIMTLGNNVVKALLPRMLLLWRNSFPRTSKELEFEKARGDAFTWQVTLEGRAGALSSIYSFLYHCPDLVTEEITNRLLVPIESALAMMTNLSNTLKTYGQQLKASAATLRFRLYETLAMINPTCFERSFTHMLRFVVWELTLNDNAANTTTSVFTRVCQSNSIFHSLVSDHMSIEDQLQPTGAAGSGAIEHDPCSLYRSVSQGTAVPVPLPLGVAVIDAAIELFGLLYPHVSAKHRSQLIDHFVECLKVTKYARKEAVLVNIYSAVLCAMKAVRKLTNANDAPVKKDAKATEELQLISQQLVLNALAHTSPTLRCASAEVLGRIAQAISDSKFTTEMAQYCAEKLKVSREVASRTGHSLALGCLHKYLGGMDSSRHQHGSVSILLNLAQDSSSPETQMWALHSLALIADTGGPLFRSYVEPSLSLVVKLIATVPLSTVDLRQATGKMMGALITGIGPELQVGGNKEAENIKTSFDMGCFLLSRTEEHSLVQNEAITCFQRLHMFGGSVNFNVLVPVLYQALRSPNLALRRSAVDCLRQLSQRDSNIICQRFSIICQQDEECPYAEYGLIGALFGMLDIESDEILRNGVKDTLTSVLSTTHVDKAQLQLAIALCKSILTCDAGGEDGTPDEAAGEFDDEEEFKISDEANGTTHAGTNSRWASRVFAAECVRKILIMSPFISKETGTELLRHLSDLIRMFFMGATSNSDQLRLEGLLNLETIIEKFAHVKDPDFPTSSILEQFQAQVSAALRPAFSVETDPFVKATACRVCSAWICGNSQGGEDLRRVHTLMVSALENLRNKPTLPDYNESANTLEKLAVLKAWSQVFIASVENGLQAGDNLTDIIHGNTGSKNHLLELVKPELEVLCPLWLSALKDRALIELPPEFAPQLPREGGSFFSNETKEAVKGFYQDAWPPILLACAICVSTVPDLVVKFELEDKREEAKAEKFHLVFGLSLEALCKPPFSDSLDVVDKFMKSLWALLSSKWPRDLIMKEHGLAVELCSVLHRQLVTRSDIRIQKLVISVLRLIIVAVGQRSQNGPKENGSAVDSNGGGNGVTSEKSLVLSILEVVFCLLMQKIRILNSNISGFHLKPTGTPDQNGLLMAETVKCLEILPDICSDEDAIAVQPTILYLTTCVLGEYAHDSRTCTALLQFYKKMTTFRQSHDPKWEKYLLSTLAKLLDLAKTGGDDNSCTTREGCVNLLAAITIFMREMPPTLLRIPNILYPSINLYQQALQSEDDYVRTHSVQQICEVFEKVDRSIATHFIHALAPRVLQMLYSEESLQVRTKSHLEFILQSINVLHVLVNLVESTETRVQMLTLIVPVLVNFLLDTNVPTASVNSYRRQLHDISLQKLVKIGPQYPQEFRLLMNQSSEMRLKLENAVKSGRTSKQDEKTIPIATPAASTIKLKTDFSNYA